MPVDNKPFYSKLLAATPESWRLRHRSFFMLWPPVTYLVLFLFLYILITTWEQWAFNHGRGPRMRGGLGVLFIYLVTEDRKNEEWLNFEADSATIFFWRRS
jgi:hypothetical protein